MLERSSKKKGHRDLNQIAAYVVEAATDETPESAEEPNGKNPAAVALGRLGGLKGGKARAEKLSAKKRAAIAKKAALARWQANSLNLH